MIREIHLIHHSHTDIGYTDLPSTVWDLQADYIRQAMRFAAETADYPEAARFRWTCESAVVVARFLSQAAEAERSQFEELVRCGQIEVTAAPFNIQGPLDEADWGALWRGLAPMLRRFGATAAFQNDVNGMTWGLLPSLRASGIRYVWMGMNEYSGGPPMPPFSLFQWEGPDGGRMPAWIGPSYASGIEWFERESWRRGPVPPVHDVWFSAPRGGQILGDGPEALRAAHQRLHEMIAKHLAGYPWSIVPLQIVNMWRCDNDPPCRQLSEFVRAWNAAGLEPRLRISTPSPFMRAIEAEAAGRAPIVRGDWPDWWVDGITSMPVELAMFQRAKRRLAETAPAARLLESREPDVAARAQRLLFDAALFAEHTWGSYESGAYPYSLRNLGCWMQKADIAYRAEEESRRLAAEVIRASPHYRPASETRHLAVLNPLDVPQSGWAEISATALREPASAVRDMATDRTLPLEDVLGAEWSTADESAARPFEVPEDTWGLVAVRKRFYVRGLAPGEVRRYELIQADLPPAPRAETEGSNEHIEWRWDTTAGRLVSLRDRTSGADLVDTAAPWAFGGVIHERIAGFAGRQAVLSHRSGECRDRIVRTPARLIAWESQPSHYSARYRLTLDLPGCRRVEQVLDFPAGERGVDIRTTFWLDETVAPQAIYMAFPLALGAAEAAYYAVGHRTRVGHDQMPGACGEYALVGEGVEFMRQGLAVALATPDTPVGCFEDLHSRNGRKVFAPANARFFSFITQNYWMTNFQVTHATKLSVAHRLRVGEGGHAVLRGLAGSLWTFPSA